MVVGVHQGGTGPRSSTSLCPTHSTWNAFVPVEWHWNPVESGGMGWEWHWNPQEWTGIPVESTGMGQNSGGICKSGLTKVEGLVRNMNVVYFLYYNTFILNIFYIRITGRGGRHRE